MIHTLTHNLCKSVHAINEYHEIEQRGFTIAQVHGIFIISTNKYRDR